MSRRNLRSPRSRLAAAILAAKAEAEQAYREALAFQTSGKTALGEWGRFADALAVVLAGRSSATEWAWLNKVGYPVADESGIRAGIRAILTEVADWKGGAANVGRWVEMAHGIASHERVAALPELDARSPDFAAMRSGRLPGATTPFRAAGVTEGQRRGLAGLLADSMLERPRLSVVGKRIDGLGLGDFVTTARAELGVRLTDARLETVMRTSVATAKTEAENGIMERPTVRLMAPLMEWQSVRDKRTRPTHALMHGYANTVEAYRIMRLGPPGGFNCRCFRAPMSLARCVVLGLTDRDGQPNPGKIRAHNGARAQMIEAGVFPDPGFSGP